MMGPVAPKIVLASLIALGLGTYFGAELAFIETPPIGKELVSIGIFIFGLGVAWATIKGDLKSIKKDLESNTLLLKTEVNGKLQLMDHKINGIERRTVTIEHQHKRGHMNDGER